MMPSNTAFYLGRLYDSGQGKTLDKPLLYDPADLTTHAFVTGMTGSGKTGLCIALLEEAALNGIPAILVDPKGDLADLLLHFPALLPADFQPWIDVDAARRQGKTPEAAAQETAQRWQAGLAEWGISPDRIAALQQAVEFAVYTPGSDAGQQVSILASLQAPSIPWEGNREVLREKISSTVTALLSLVGLTDIDPMRSREHILLSNIFEAAWSQGKDLDLSELIMQTQTPPFPKLGVFPVESFFPQKDRSDLAMLLNNFLAAPTFQTWLEGQPLDVPSLLFTPGGRPRHSVFYLAHLSDVERMFFVTLLFSAVETWMRTQSGSASLRALLYFDEIAGYLPPVSNPPAKPVMLRLLKQARAFGVGLLLASQNPVDIDYKGLSNAGTWFIGKLQTEQDKQRLLDGLSSADGSLDRAQYDRLISGLSQRIFLLHNVHQTEPVIFQTRWTMNYLAGPLTPAQIPALNKLASNPDFPTPRPGVSDVSPLPVVAVTLTVPTVQEIEKVAPTVPGPTVSSITRPAVPSTASEYFMPNNRTLAQALQAENQSVPDGTPAPEAPEAPEYLYRPALVAQAHVRYLAHKYNLDMEQVRTALVPSLDRRGIVRWDNFSFSPLDEKQLLANGLPQARFASLEDPLGNAKVLTALQKDCVDWVYRTSQVRLHANEALKVYAGPETTMAAFHDLCSQAAHAGGDAELAKSSASYDAKLEALKTRLANAQREVGQREDDYNQRKMEEIGTGVENVIGLFTKSRRRVTTSLTKRRLTEDAKAKADDAKAAVVALQNQLAALDKERQSALQQTGVRWAKLVDNISEIPLTPQLKDVYLELFGVIWLPFYVLKVGDRVVELAAYS
jgi:hypothetical protein